MVTFGAPLWYESVGSMTVEPVHRTRVALALAIAALCVLLLVSSAQAEQASSGADRTAAGFVDAGDKHTCAILADRSVHCWGIGGDGRLGYGTTGDIGDAADAGPVDLGPGRSARAFAAGFDFSCAILDTGAVRCWGGGANGRLGNGSTAPVLTPAAGAPVDFGPNLTATAITAGYQHACAILSDGSVRCWGLGTAGRLGYGSQASVGDNEQVASVAPVDLGAGRRAVAISAGWYHTCAIRDDGQLLCWGYGAYSQLGYPGTASVGDDETPGAVGPVPLNGHAVRAVSAGDSHTCVILDDGSARCWGLGTYGRLGYGSTATVTTAAAAPPINLGPGRSAAAISTYLGHTCAILDSGDVRCWGLGGNGRLGYGNQDGVGDDPGETPASAGPVPLAGHQARAITVGISHTCALLDDASMRCWGFGGDGRLGYGDNMSVGDSPSRSVALAGPVPLSGAVGPLVADLALTMGTSAGQIGLGGTMATVVSVTNAGPDAADGISVAVPTPPGLSFVGAGTDRGTFGAGGWQIGSLPPGGRATLTLIVRGDAAGTFQIAAEVASSSVLDPTSTPGNGAIENDRAGAILQVSAPPVVNGTPTLRPLPRSLGMSITRSPKRGRVKSLTVTGRLLLPRVVPAPRCAGRVQVLAKVGSSVVARRTVALAKRKGVCRYTAVLKPKAPRTARAVKVSARFLGTTTMRPRSAATRSVRIR